MKENLIRKKECIFNVSREQRNFNDNITIIFTLQRIRYLTIEIEFKRIKDHFIDLIYGYFAHSVISCMKDIFIN